MSDKEEQTPPEIDAENSSQSLPEQPPAKKQKVLENEELYLKHLPSAECYEKSYMHRDIITHIVVSKTEFIATGSCDGHVKFWKKTEDSIEFVKHFRAHLGAINDMVDNYNGSILASVATDKSMKIFDIINFDMINMIKLDYIPQCVCWIHSTGDPVSTLAVSEAENHTIYVYDGMGRGDPLHKFEKLHLKPVVLMKFNPVYEIAVSADESGILEYWTGAKYDYKFPKRVKFESKLDTDLYEFFKCKTYPTGLCFNKQGNKFATISLDRKIRVFQFLTGKMLRVIDESLSVYQEMQLKKQQLPNMEFVRRMAVEKDLEKTGILKLCNILFDESGNFLLFPTLLGVKMINLYTNRLTKIIGKTENLRILRIALFQGIVTKSKAAVTVEMKASENPNLESVQPDPTLFCTALKKNRFYIFTRREPDDTPTPETDRDIFNEKPSKEDIISATEAAGIQRLYENAIIHTTMGDIHLKLFKECPKAVENFCVHSKNGYYNGHIFHRVIKGFMVQTGDPTGTGSGGESIWGGEFEDEFRPNLKHDRPYTLSMANAGPNTNGSQFFITIIPTPWLDNKHTVFGRVTKGMEVAQNISNVKTNPKTDKPHDDVQIISVTVK
ncbi:hypothetical protein V9T40_001667 [Parthenolecanium corni]|uniref:peptidylprolyl isomerase n=1 Tax=Parthenolecanium corni TaxID=536013 RepID=A0AAN9TIE7_9HEMI